MLNDHQTLQVVHLSSPSNEHIAKVLVRTQARVSALVQQTDNVGQEALVTSQQALVSV